MRSLLEDLQNSVNEQRERYEKTCVEKITQKERELTAAVHAWNSGEKSLLTEKNDSSAGMPGLLSLFSSGT
jgi:predicted HD phosphohydrolase